MVPKRAKYHIYHAGILIFFKILQKNIKEIGERFLVVKTGLGSSCTNYDRYESLDG